MIVVGFWKTLGVYFFNTDDFIFWDSQPCSRYAVGFSKNQKV